MQIDLQSGKKIYFASDQHFGVPDLQQSRIREEKFIRWMDSIKKNAQVLFLMGDLFDFGTSGNMLFQKAISEF